MQDLRQSKPQPAVRDGRSPHVFRPGDGPQPRPQAPRPGRRLPRAQLLRKAGQHDRRIYLAFLIPLVILGLLFPLLPKVEKSLDENRALAKRPQFSWQALLAGEFNQAFESYFTDQFPGRAVFLSVNRGLKKIQHYFPSFGGDQIQMITTRKDSGGQGTPDPASLPTAAESVTEPVEPVPVETTAPGPDPNREIKETAIALSNQENLDYETSNIVIIHGRAMEILYYSPELTEAYANRINHVRQVLPPEKRLISMVVPTSIAFYGTDDLREGAHSTIDVIRNVYQHESPEIFKVDAYSELAAHIDEYIYFRTDHHWNGKGAYYAYRAFCETLGLEAMPLNDMTYAQPEGTFLGSLYGYTDKSPLLEGSADQADMYIPPYEADYNYYLDAGMEEAIGGTLLAAGYPADNHYMLYLGGDVPLGHIHSDVGNGKSIMVVKDSFGNAFIPYLINNYEDIYLVDPRNFTDSLLDFIEQKNIEDVLVMNYTFATSNPTWLDGFDRITGYQEPDVVAED